MASTVPARGRRGIWRILGAPVDAATALLAIVSPVLGFVALIRDKLAEGFAGLVHGDFDREPSPLEAELDAVRGLVAPHRLRLSVSATAMKAMQMAKLNRPRARKYVYANIRKPLLGMIERGEVRDGQLVIVDWDGGIALRATDPGRTA